MTARTRPQAIPGCLMLSVCAHVKCIARRSVQYTCVNPNGTSGARSRPLPTSTVAVGVNACALCRLSCVGLTNFKSLPPGLNYPHHPKCVLHVYTCT